MSTDTQRPLARLSLRLPSEFYNDWLIAETAASLALDAWRKATTHAKARAFAAYQLALEDEAQAAERLAARLSIA